MGRCSNLLVNLDAEGLDDVSDGLLAAGVEHPVLYGAVVTGHRIDEGWNGVRERLISIGKKSVRRGQNLEVERLKAIATRSGAIELTGGKTASS